MRRTFRWVPCTDLPPAMADNVLAKVLATATVLACNLAFQDVVEKFKEHTGGEAGCQCLLAG